MLIRKHVLSYSYPRIGFRLAGWRFTPGLASTLVALFVVPTFLCLGSWQWQRFQSKAAFIQNQETRKLLLTSSWANVLQTKKSLQDLEGIRIQTEGKFINQQIILLDNQIFKGQVGYKVLTPLLIPSPLEERMRSALPTLGGATKRGISSNQTSHTLLLVDRGWIPLGTSRAVLPTIPPIEGSIRMEGRLYKPVYGLKLRSGRNLKQPQSKENPTPLRVLGIDLKELEQAMEHTIYPLILRLEPGDKLGFEIIPFEAHGGIPASKHLGYALQWFMMALAVLIYYIVINISCEKK